MIEVSIILMIETVLYKVQILTDFIIAEKYIGVCTFSEFH